MIKPSKPTSIQLLALLLELRKVIDARPSRRPKWFWPSFGLCTNFTSLAELRGYGSLSFTSMFGKQIKEWPFYTGNYEYPIPTTGKHSDLNAYHYCRNKYDRRNEYCRLRRNLLDTIIINESLS